MQDQQSWRASYTNGPKPLTLAEVLGGPISHPDGRHAGSLETGVRGSAPAASAARTDVRSRLMAELERR
jgi:hypothetical protein